MSSLGLANPIYPMPTTDLLPYNVLCTLPSCGKSQSGGRCAKVGVTMLEHILPKGSFLHRATWTLLMSHTMLWSLFNKDLYTLHAGPGSHCQQPVTALSSTARPHHDALQDIFQCNHSTLPVARATNGTPPGCWPLIENCKHGLFFLR